MTNSKSMLLFFFFFKHIEHTAGYRSFGWKKNKPKKTHPHTLFPNGPLGCVLNFFFSCYRHQNKFVGASIFIVCFGMNINSPLKKKSGEVVKKKKRINKKPQPDNE